MSASSVRSLMADAQNAIASEDWATAKSKAQQALALLVSMPDGGAGGERGVTLEWDRDALQRFVNYCETQLATTTQTDGGNSLFGEQKIRYARATR